MTILWTDGDGGTRGGSSPATMPKPSKVLRTWLDRGEGIWIPGRIERLAILSTHSGRAVPCRCQLGILKEEALDAGIAQGQNEDVFSFIQRVYGISNEVIKAALRANDRLDDEDDQRIGADLEFWKLYPREGLIDEIRSISPKYLGRVIAVYEAAGL